VIQIDRRMCDLTIRHEDDQCVIDSGVSARFAKRRCCNFADNEAGSGYQRHGQLAPYVESDFLVRSQWAGCGSGYQSSQPIKGSTPRR